MINYNDFPNISNEQYRQMQNEYQTNLIDCKQLSSQLYQLLDFCHNSFTEILTKSNTLVMPEIKKNITNIHDIKSSLLLMYPKSKVASNEITQNIFAVLSKMVDCSLIFNKLINIETKSYNLTLLKKLNNDNITMIKDLLTTLASCNFRLFRFM